MPLYEYECQQCHKRLEKIQKFSDADLTVCPLCSGRLERTITAAAFSFSGGGWYKDGYASAKPGAAAAGGEGAGTATTSDSAASTATPASSEAAKPAAPASAPSAPAASAPAPAAKP